VKYSFSSLLESESVTLPLKIMYISLKYSPFLMID